MNAEALVPFPFFFPEKPVCKARRIPAKHFKVLTKILLEKLKSVGVNFRSKNGIKNKNQIKSIISLSKYAMDSNDIIFTQDTYVHMSVFKKLNSR